MLQRAYCTEELFLLLSFLISEPHALRVIPLVALIALNVQKIRVEGLLTGAERLPLLKGWLEDSLQRVVASPSEISQVIDVVKLIVFLDGVHFTFACDAVDIDLVVVIGGEDLIITDIV